MIEPGRPAPDFELEDQAGRSVRLSELRGRRVLIVFYPQDFSPVCSDQLSVYERAHPELSERGVEVLAISIDHQFAHRAFAEQLGTGIRLLADFHPRGEVCRAYGAMIEERGHANRSLVLVDPDGFVEWVHESPTPLEVPGVNLVFDALAEAGEARG